MNIRTTYSRTAMCVCIFLVCLFIGVVMADWPDLSDQGGQGGSVPEKSYTTPFKGIPTQGKGLVGLRDYAVSKVQGPGKIVNTSPDFSPWDHTSFVNARLPPKTPTPVRARVPPPKVNISVTIIPFFLPDLVVVEGQRQEMELAVGEPFATNYSVRNTGQKDAGPFYVQVVLSRCPDKPFCTGIAPAGVNQTGEGGYAVLLTKYVGKLAAGETVSHSASLAVPDDAATGPHTLWVVVDSGNEVTESKKDNNRVSIARIAVSREPRCHLECPGEVFPRTVFEDPCRTVCT